MDRGGPAGWLGAIGHYAGAASRFAAYAVDVIVSWAAFTLGLAGITFAIRIVTGRSVSWHLGGSIAVAVVFAAWELTYFGYCWATAGRTAGMALFGLRVVRADGGDLDPWRGVIRALAFPLSIVLCGLGFIGIVAQREHRALHDLLAGTAVVYSWDTRAARLRSLARAAGRPAGRPSSGPG
ncbi:MAG: RDD family protein [Trebonia sp.]